MSESVTYIGPPEPMLTVGAEYEVVRTLPRNLLQVVDDNGWRRSLLPGEYKKHENPATEGGVVLDTPEGRVVGESVQDVVELHALACEQDGQNRGDG